MTSKPIEIEGTWEDILTLSSALAGHQVRVTIIPKETPLQPAEKPPAFRPASGRSLLRHAGTWAGDDIEECLQLVYDNRAPLEF